jgi:hypothetical protein
MGGQEMSPAEYLDPDVELPAAPDGWLERFRLTKNIVPEWGVIHKIYACNLPEGEYTGEGENGAQQAYKAWRYAQARNMKAKGSLLGLTFYVTPDMTQEEAGLSLQATIMDHGRNMEKLAATDTLDVTGHSQAWERAKKEQPKEVAYAERLGLLFQAEMKAAEKSLDTDMIARTIFFQDQIYGDGDANHRQAAQLLFTCWKHGLEFARAIGMDNEEIRQARKKSMDVVKNPGNDGPDI